MEATNNTGYLLQHLASVLARQSDQALQERLGIGFSQFKILMVLRSDPSIQQNYIASALGQTEASVSRQIKLLQKQDMLMSRKDPQNRRVHLTTPTAKGIRITDEALDMLNNYHAPTFGRLNEKQQRQLSEILTVLHDGACTSGNHPLVS